MSVWFENYPEKLENEIKILKANGIDVQRNEELFKEKIVQLKCRIPVQNTFGLELEEDLELQINFPDNYPFFRPEVVATNIRLPRHQNYLDGNLCLIHRPSQFWDIPENIFEYLSERLPLVFEKGNIVDDEKIKADPNEQAEPLSEYFYTPTNIAILSDRPTLFDVGLPQNDDNLEILDHGFLKIGFQGELGKTQIFESRKIGELSKYFPTPSVNGDIAKCFVLDWLDQESKSLMPNPSFDINKLRGVHNIFTTKWYRINNIKLLEDRNLLSSLMEELSVRNIQKPVKRTINFYDLKGLNFVAILFPEETAIGQKGWGWMFLVNGEVKHINGQRPNEKLNSNLNLPIISLQKEDYMQRIPNSKTLHGKTISIIGLGTIGAPSVIEFAKNGVSKLKLMDFDIVDVSSSSRWPLGIEYSGSSKTLALKQFIDANYPFVDVEIVNHKIGSTSQLFFNNEDEKIKWLLDDCSLLYDASAEEGVNNLISRLCKNRSIPYMSIEARRGAWGGIVMRVVPSETKGCWMCLQYHLNDGTIKPPNEDKNGGIQPQGCGDVTFTGSSFDLQNISLAGVRMAVDVLKVGKQTGSWDVGILNMVDDKGIEIPPSWEVHKLVKHPDCPYCKE
ncbi:ThiF family adenylyltransferase [Flagellimonas beolgyonensis]|uniref:ThiF family adenylyltransferase n=1 Tax=Flagellimonas beolgyonensis TaxID=864064 RepID=UPI000F8EE9C0|nr:ThiF family adenylyltransferase [Allomuricauda beolgyonensis]